MHGNGGPTVPAISCMPVEGLADYIGLTFSILGDNSDSTIKFTDSILLACPQTQPRPSAGVCLWHLCRKPSYARRHSTCAESCVTQMRGLGFCQRKITGKGGRLTFRSGTLMKDPAQVSVRP